MRQLRSASRGFSLVGVLITSAIMAIVAVGFSRFMFQASRGQQFLEKAGEASEVDQAIRMLLSNTAACMATATHINLNQTGPEQTTPLSIYDAQGAAAFTEGKVYGQMQLTYVRAQVSTVNQHVQSVRIRTRLTKTGTNNLGAQYYEHLNYLNIAVTGGVATNCLNGAVQQRVDLLSIDPVTITASSSGGVLQILGNGMTSPFPGQTLAAPAIPGACGGYNCAPSNRLFITGPNNAAFQASGNIITLQVSTQIGAANNGSQVAVSCVSIEVVGPGNVVVGSVPIGVQYAPGTVVNSSSFVSTGVPVTVVPKTNYTLRVRVDGQLTNGPGQIATPFSASSLDVSGALYQYMKY